MAYIVILSGEKQGHCLRLSGRTNVIGRDESLYMQLLDQYVSRHHLKISFDSAAGQYCVEDAGSTSGVCVNREAIDGKCALYDGDLIQIGKTDLRFRTGDLPADAKDVLDSSNKAGENQRDTFLPS